MHAMTMDWDWSCGFGATWFKDPLRPKSTISQRIRISIYKKGDLSKDIVFVADSLNNNQPRDGLKLDQIKWVKIICYFFTVKAVRVTTDNLCFLQLCIDPWFA